MIDSDKTLQRKQFLFVTMLHMKLFKMKIVFIVSLFIYIATIYISRLYMATGKIKNLINNCVNVSSDISQT